jgi:nucleoside-diphosphate-sugar epimerase
MRIFVAGATGAIGRPLVSKLITAGHSVIGLTHSEDGARNLRAKGAEGVLADALDPPAIHAALRKARPDAVIEELTSLPKRYTPEEMRAAADRDRKLRLEGGLNFQNAARAVGVRRYIVQSSGFGTRPVRDSRVKQIHLLSMAHPGFRRARVRLRKSNSAHSNRQIAKALSFDMVSFMARELGIKQMETSPVRFAI